MSGPLVSIVIEPGSRVTGSGDVAVPTRSFLRLDDLGRELASALDEPVQVVEMAEASLELPDGLLLVLKPESIERLTCAAGAPSLALARRIIALQVPRGGLLDFLERTPVAAAVSHDRFIGWVWSRARPLPSSLFVRRDLLRDDAALSVDREGIVAGHHVAIDGTGSAPLVPALAAVARSWRRNVDP